MKSDLGFVACFGYKWEHEKEARCLTISKKDLRHFDDGPLLRKAAKIYEDADLVVGHFASVFDRRFFQGRLAINHLDQIPPTRLRDTCMIARSAFNFSSNRLGHLANLLKLKHRKQVKRSGSEWPGWWYEVMQGNMGSLFKMAAYCQKDVLTTEDLYHFLRRFDNAHPRIVEDRSKCGVCGGDVEYRGHAWANGNRYRRYVCVECRRWDRETKKIA